MHYQQHRSRGFERAYDTHSPSFTRGFLILCRLLTVAALTFAVAYLLVQIIPTPLLLAYTKILGSAEMIPTQLSKTGVLFRFLWQIVPYFLASALLSWAGIRRRIPLIYLLFTVFLFWEACGSLPTHMLLSTLPNTAAQISQALLLVRLSRHLLSSLLLFLYTYRLALQAMQSRGPSMKARRRRLSFTLRFLLWSTAAVLFETAVTYRF